MRKGIYLLALAPLALVGCASEPTTVTTTTTTQEVTTAGPTREVVVTRTPPAVRVESQTVAPGPGYVYTRGYWRWSGADYVWMPGNWVVRPRPAAMWVEGQWVRRGGGWVWMAGHWQ
jgi:WXXGXW repeat (2 copies)